MNSSQAFTQVKWLAIFLAAFFTLSGFAEYVFVKKQLNRTMLAELSESADQIIKAVNYPVSAANSGEYNKAFIDSRDYFVVLSDGYLFDNGAGKNGFPRACFPRSHLQKMKNPFMRVRSSTSLHSENAGI